MPRRYGPFWICTTLIFVAASIGTFATYLAHKLQKKEWNYDINVVTWSAGLFYGYVTIVPVVLYIILKYFSAPSGLVQLFCLYGYSLFAFIPALVSLNLQFWLMFTLNLIRKLACWFFQVLVKTVLEVFSVIFSPKITFMTCLVRNIGHDGWLYCQILCTKHVLTS